VHGQQSDDQPLGRVDGDLYNRADLVLGYRHQNAVDVLGLESSRGVGED
jgi:hypothetical protein